MACLCSRSTVCPACSLQRPGSSWHWSQPGTQTKTGSADVADEWLGLADSGQDEHVTVAVVVFLMLVFFNGKWLVLVIAINDKTTWQHIQVVAAGSSSLRQLAQPW